jgi:hypothetical protein
MRVEYNLIQMWMKELPKGSCINPMSCEVHESSKTSHSHLYKITIEYEKFFYQGFTLQMMDLLTHIWLTPSLYIIWCKLTLTVSFQYTKCRHEISQVSHITLHTPSQTSNGEKKNHPDFRIHSQSFGVVSNSMKHSIQKFAGYFLTCITTHTVQYVKQWG